MSHVAVVSRTHMLYTKENVKLIVLSPYYVFLKMIILYLIKYCYIVQHLIIMNDNP